MNQKLRAGVSGLLICSASILSLTLFGCGGGSSPSQKLSPPGESAPVVKLPTTALTFPDGKTITVEVARTPKTREYGLMMRTSLPKNYGMLFVFAREQGYQFWMKNTWVNLDMIFIDGRKRITEAYKSVPRSAPDTPEANLARRGGLAQFVLELPEGAADRHHLKAGQQFQFNVDIPPE